MPDKFTETTTTGYGTRIVDSIKGITFGVILFFGSFILLYWNEGSVDFSVLARNAREIISTSTSQTDALQGSLVSTTGLLSSNEMLGDNLFLNPGRYIVIKRVVEMYAWKERKQSKTIKNFGGSETTETIYSYEKKWRQKPYASNDFKHSEGHVNPVSSVSDIEIKVQEATLGIYKVDMEFVDLPKNFTPLILNQQNITLNQQAHLVDEQYIFVSKTGNSTFESPEIGDLRVSYKVLPSGKMSTIFGKLDGDKMVPHVDVKGNLFYRILSGHRDQAIHELHAEYNKFLWIFRLIGFLMMWLGLSLLLGPISVVLDVIPFFGSLSGAVIGLITFLVALPLSILVILISMILHSIIAFIIMLVLILTSIIIGLKRVNKTKKKIAS